MTDYPTQFGPEENESMVVDRVDISSDERDSTPCSSPEHYFTAHSSDEYNAINQFKIVQPEETVVGTPRPPYTWYISLANSSVADETFADWSGWAQGPATGLLHSNFLGSHPMEFCRQLTPIPESPESPPPSGSNEPSSSTIYPLREISTIPQELRNLTLRAHMQDDANITGCLVCGKPYEQVIDDTAADYLYQTAQTHETIRERLLKHRAFTDGLQCGVFTFLLRGMSQAPACDGQMYDITCRNVHNGNHETFLPLFLDERNN